MSKKPTINDRVAALEQSVALLQDQLASLNNAVIGVMIETGITARKTKKMSVDEYGDFLHKNVRDVCMSTENLSKGLYKKVQEAMDEKD